MLELLEFLMKQPLGSATVGQTHAELLIRTVLGAVAQV